MSFIQASIVVTLIVHICLGVIVFLTNRRRSANQQFLTLSGVIGIWLVCIGMALTSTQTGWAAFWIRQASVAALLVPFAFDLLRLAIVKKEVTWWNTVVNSASWIGWTLFMVVLCQTDFFLSHATLLDDAGGATQVPEPAYGPGFMIYNLYFLLACALVIYRFIRDVRRMTGIQRTELQFVLLGWAICCFVGVTFTLILPLATGGSQSAQFAPLCVIILDAVIAYGIATQRIMGVADVLRRMTAYGLLTAYLLGLYALVYSSSSFAMEHLFGHGGIQPHVLAALALAFSMAPMNGVMQRFARRMFISSHTLDMSTAVQRANRVLQSITTLDELLKSFGELIAEALGTDAVRILFAEGSTYEQHYPLEPGTQLIWLQRDKDPLVRVLQEMRSPLVADTLQRRRTTELEEQALAQLHKLDAAAAVGIWSKGRLEGFLLLGSRMSGRMYGALEQDALQLLCDQLAVAVENARLYTQVQDGKIYNEILLDNLVSGVIAANARGTITIFNREAQRITRKASAEILQKPLDDLPKPIADAMRHTLESGGIDYEEEAVIEFPDGEEAAIRMGCTTFRGHAGNLLGVLLVFNDMTKMRKLEMQVRRTDRLASIGTLAAGMAHEIKNPLVTIKTFTQLLPERYADVDFRDTFSSLIGHEVKRIDTIVNQLLNFARPTKPSLQPLSLRHMLEDSLRLVHEQLKQKNITLESSFTDERDMINADADLLEQAFINFFLNAIESMDGRGQLHVQTEVIDRTHATGQTFWGEGQPDKSVRVRITDTGKGIASEDVAHVFDPFFTTKSEGTGLGLSVSHGIIQDHGGVIDVESEVSVGTTFHIAFPLLKEKAVL